MDKRIKELVEYIGEMYHLNNYFLKKWDISRSITLCNDTVYTLSTEWFPKPYTDWDDKNYNPKGTAIIEIDIHNRKTKSIIFAGGISYADQLMFDWNNRNDIITWIEQTTGLNYGKHFEYWREEERKLHFKEYIDGYAVSPSSYIDLKLDATGKLLFFSVTGQFSVSKLVRREIYTLSLDQVEQLAKKQLKLISFPNTKQEKLVTAYAIEEIYIKNDGTSTLPFEIYHEEKSRLKMDFDLKWTHHSPQPFHREVITWNEQITPEQVFQCEPHPDLQPIKEEEIKKCISAIQTFLSQVYVNDSGKWVLTSLCRDKRYIIATIHLKEQSVHGLERKMKLFIDSTSYTVLNYMDNKALFETYMDYEETESIEVTKDKAYEKLKDFIELTPYYVYDVEQDCYVCCGKLDCHYAVNAHNGAVVTLREL